MMQRRSLLLLLPLTVACLALAPVSVSAAPSERAQRCTAGKLAAASNEIAARLRCERRDLATGADPACLAAAAARRDDAFARAERRGGCASRDDSEWYGQVAAFIAGIPLEDLRPSGPAASACTARRLGLAARAVTRVAEIALLDARRSDPVRIGRQVEAARNDFLAEYERAGAAGDCLSGIAGARVYDVLTEIYARDFRELLCPSCDVACPCWSPIELALIFRPGFFDTMGGAVCDATDASLTSGAGCTTPVGEFGLPRAGAFLFGGSCALMPFDYDPDASGSCGGIPAIESLDASQAPVCEAVLRGSAPYVRECGSATP